MSVTNPLLMQVGGSHYKDMAYQPVEFIHECGIGFLAGCIIKRICRFDKPTGKGLQDLEKCLHVINILASFVGTQYDRPWALFQASISGNSEHYLQVKADAHFSEIESKLNLFLLKNKFTAFKQNAISTAVFSDVYRTKTKKNEALNHLSELINAQLEFIKGVEHE